MRHIIWLLFFPGILGNGKILTITPNALAAWEGSCIVIPCQIGLTQDRMRVDRFSLIFYFAPTYDVTLKDYTGVMLYSGSKSSENYLTPTSPPFLGRVRFVGNLTKRNCSLKISQLQKSDSGSYGARLYGFVGNRRTVEKWFVGFTVDVNEAPPKPKLEGITGSIKEGKQIAVTCSVSYSCPDEPIALTLSGLEEDRMSLQKTTIENGKLQTVLYFSPTWKDHGKALTCLLRSHNGMEISQSTVELDVKYAPKGVKLSAKPGTTVREGERLTLTCSIKSTNPEVTYQWYWKNMQKNEWMNQQKKLDPIREEDSGGYKCTARNEVGTRSSETVTIDVQYPPKDVKVEVPSTIKEGNRVVLRCSSRGNPTTSRHGWYKGSESGIIGTEKELRLESIQSRDSGTYYCIAYNTIGNSTSSPVTLDVHYGPRNVHLFLSTQDAITEGMNVLLQCDNDANPPADAYKWYRNEQMLQETSKILQLKKIQLNQSGSYRCKTSNDIFEQESLPIAITVSQEPQASSLPYRTPGQNFSLCPTSQASPPPEPSSPTQSVLPLPLPSQTPCDGKDLLEELCSLRKLQAQALQDQNLILSRLNELSSAIGKLTEKLLKVPDQDAEAVSESV